MRAPDLDRIWREATAELGIVRGLTGEEARREIRLTAFDADAALVERAGIPAVQLIDSEVYDGLTDALAAAVGRPIRLVARRSGS